METSRWHWHEAVIEGSSSFRRNGRCTRSVGNAASISPPASPRRGAHSRLPAVRRVRRRLLQPRADRARSPPAPSTSRPACRGPSPRRPSASRPSPPTPAASPPPHRSRGRSEADRAAPIACCDGSAATGRYRPRRTPARDRRCAPRSGRGAARASRQRSAPRGPREWVVRADHLRRAGAKSLAKAERWCCRSVARWRKLLGGREPRGVAHGRSPSSGPRARAPLPAPAAPLRMRA